MPTLLEWKKAIAYQCVGYKRPFYIGGSDDVTNLEMVDFDVYRSLSAQIRPRFAIVGRNAGPGWVSIRLAEVCFPLAAIPDRVGCTGSLRHDCGRSRHVRFLRLRGEV